MAVKVSKSKSQPTKRKKYRKRLLTEKDTVKKSVRKNGKFVKGHSGCPTGRPKGSKNKWSIGELTKAIQEVQKTKKKNWLKHLVTESYEDHALAIALLRKLMPDLKSIEDILSVYAPSMSEEQAAEIRKTMEKRFNK